MDEEEKQELERKQDELTLLSAENKLSGYVGKWAIKTVALALSPRTDRMSSTVDDTND